MSFEIRYERVWRLSFTLIGLGPKRSGITIDGDMVTVRMGWAFTMTVPRDAVEAAAEERRFISRGVHGWRGRYLVNGSGKGLVRLTIDPPQRARASLFPVKVGELIVSVDEQQHLLATLGSPDDV